MSTVAEILANAAGVLKLNVPVSFVGGNQTARTLVTALNLAGAELVSEYVWPVLTKEYSFALVAGQSAYALPSDYDRPVDNTAWNTTSMRPVQNGITPYDYQTLRNSVGVVPLVGSMRSFGWLNSQINLYFTPTTSNAGEVIKFEYISNCWNKPRTWEASTALVSGESVWYNGNRYLATTSGTTGSTAPTHTSGSVASGTVQLSYVAGYGTQTVVADRDIPHLDSLLLTYDVICRVGGDEGFDVSEYETKKAKRIKVTGPSLTGASDIHQFAGRHQANYPETGFGGI